MTQEEFQNLVLQKFDSIDKKFDSIDKKFDSIDKRFDSMDKSFNSMAEDLKTLKSDVKGIKTQQEEHGQILQALLHNQEVANARLEGLEISKATVESIEKLATKDDLKACMKLMNNRMFEQELEVEKLKLVK